MSRPHAQHLTVPGLFPPPGYAHVAVASGARLILTAGAVLETTVYVVAKTEADLAAVWKGVQASALAPAASTLLGVALLGYPGQLVEIEAIATKG